ncbi:MAG: polysaccharide deacetylase family protein [Clostridia bacterium]|nr:polysaccharide deacetylase family protein [Clostridia bacterium]MBQ2272984.1 polysaccharide deacetylase family protein [Clostridia bacterium]
MKVRMLISGKKAVILLIAVGVMLGCLLGAGCYRAVSAVSRGTPVPILMYHSVCHNDRIQSKYILSPETFEEDLRWLSQRGYTAVFVSDLVAYVNGEGTLPERPVVITLDDGFLNNKTNVLPLLRKYNMKAVISVVGSFCQRYSETSDPDPSYAYLTWDDIADLAASGRVEIANHTYEMHTVGLRRGCMKKSDESVAAYSAALSEDLSRLQSILSEKSGVTPTVFAYPYGAISSEAVFVLQSLGFRAALTCEERVNYLSALAPDRLYRLGRFNRPSGESTEEFMARIFGAE